MKRAVLLFTVVFGCMHAQAQQSAPPFREMLAAATTDTQKLNVYRKVYLFYRNSNADSIRYFMALGADEFMKTGYKPGQAATLAMLSGAYSDIGNMEASQKTAEDAYALYREMNDESGTAKIHNSLGVLDGKRGDFNGAVRHFIAALAYFEKINDTVNIVNTLIKIGTANSNAGNETESVEYYERALALSLKMPPSANRSYLYTNLGSHYAQKHQFEKAMPYLKKAIETADGPQMAQVQVPALMNMGNLYAEYEQPDEALTYYKRALKLARANGLKAEEAKLLHSIGYIEGLRTGDNATLQKALEGAVAMGNKVLQVNILTDLARIADREKRYEDEAKYLQQVVVLKDSVFSIERAKEITNLASKYELSKSNAELKLLRIDQQKYREKRNFIIAIACILSVALLAVVSFLLRSRRLNMKLKKRELELENANSVKDKLFSIIGHDLKGPIGNIPMLLDIYNNDATDEERKYILNALEENAQASIETLERLLNWGKMQIKGITLNQAPVAVNEVIDDTLRLFRITAGNKEITIANHVPGDLRAFADEDHFKFILRNLVSNAIKYSHHGGDIDIDAVNKGDGFITFSVTDHGMGMEAAAQEHIFEPYNKSTAGTAEELGNSIGLMLCREFAQQNGGNIWLKSRKGEGTTFYFTVMEQKEKVGKEVVV